MMFSARFEHSNPSIEATPTGMVLAHNVPNGVDEHVQIREVIRLIDVAPEGLAGQELVHVPVNLRIGQDHEYPRPIVLHPLRQPDDVMFIS